jgi:hypothetical protein
LTSFEILDKEILKNNMKTYISLSFWRQRGKTFSRRTNEKKGQNRHPR